MEDALRRSWGWILALGILMVLLGMVAMALPSVMTLGVVVLVGWLLVVGGGFHVASALRMKGAPGWLTSLALAILRVFVGVLFLLDPWAGAISVTLLIGVYVVADGLIRILLAFRMRPLPSWSWTLLGGLAALLLGILIFSKWPSSAGWVIGLFVGVNLLFDGWALVMLAAAARAALGGPGRRPLS